MGLLAAIRQREAERQKAAEAKDAKEGAPAAPPAPAPPVKPDAGAAPSRPDPVQAEVTDKLARLSTALESERERGDRVDERLARMEEQVAAIATLAESLTARYNPFAEPETGPERTLVVADTSAPGDADATPRSAPAEGAETPDASGDRPPLLAEAPHGLRGDVLLAEWARVLVDAAGPDGAARAVDAYVRRGWLGSAAADALRVHVTATEAPGGRTSDGDTAEAEWAGRFFVHLLAPERARPPVEETVGREA